jgi:hypothetical protein
MVHDAITIFDTNVFILNCFELCISLPIHMMFSILITRYKVHMYHVLVNLLMLVRKVMNSFPIGRQMYYV